MNLQGLTSCSELTKEHADEAAQSASALRALLVWAANIATPGAGAPNLLRVIARLGHATWVEGTPRVEISAADDASTKIEIYADREAGLRERIFPFAWLRAPIDEFVLALQLTPTLAAPFHVEQRDKTIVLVLAAADRAGAHKPVEIIDPHEGKTAPAPPMPEALRATARPPRPPPGVHTHPTVPCMIAVRPEALPDGVDDTDWE